MMIPTPFFFVGSRRSQGNASVVRPTVPVARDGLKSGSATLPWREISEAGHCSTKIVGGEEGPEGCSEDLLTLTSLRSTRLRCQRARKKRAIPNDTGKVVAAEERL